MTIWRDSEGIILGEVRKRKTGTLFQFYVELKKNEMKEQNKTEMDSNAENWYLPEWWDAPNR